MLQEDLDDYMHVAPTNSCYLDGRYFNLVFQNYPGLLVYPLEITIAQGRVVRETVNMRETNIDKTYPNILKVVITTLQRGRRTKHSNLVILDHENRVAHRFEPLGRTAPHFDRVNQLIEEYLSFFFDFKVETIDHNLDQILDEKNPGCQRDRTGFCNAYIILYAYCFLHGKPYNPVHIRRFAKLIETVYGPLPLSGVEIEYGLVTEGGPKGQNVAIGAGAGALGGLLLGATPIGILGGAALGGGLGAVL